MKINKKARNKIQELLFEFRLGTEDMAPGNHIKYGMYNRPGPDTPGSDEEVDKTELVVDRIKPSEISPVQLYTVNQSIDKIPDNVIELKNTINHILSKSENKEFTKKDIVKIYNAVLEVVGED